MTSLLISALWPQQPMKSTRLLQHRVHSLPNSLDRVGYRPGCAANQSISADIRHPVLSDNIGRPYIYLTRSSERNRAWSWLESNRWCIVDELNERAEAGLNRLYCGLRWRSYAVLQGCLPSPLPAPRLQPPPIAEWCCPLEPRPSLEPPITWCRQDRVIIQVVCHRVLWTKCLENS